MAENKKLKDLFFEEIALPRENFGKLQIIRIKRNIKIKKVFIPIDDYIYFVLRFIFLKTAFPHRKTRDYLQERKKDG